jgi:hypothetical protein
VVYEKWKARDIRLRQNGRGSMADSLIRLLCTRSKAVLTDWVGVVVVRSVKDRDSAWRLSPPESCDF